MQTSGLALVGPVGELFGRRATAAREHRLHVSDRGERLS